MINHNPPSILITNIKTIMRERYYYKLWHASRDRGFSRRQWLDEIANALYSFKGVIRCPLGYPIPVPHIDSIFDPDNRWMSYYLEADPDSYKPRRLSIRRPVRLQFIDTYFRIRHPSIWREFRR